ncbi:RNA polymerase sigma factor (sigma-70 family) [Actinoplanes lutulentus]|uniref:RNA polymerase sigma factor (Sigma-70 family) n=2 Tax=Actinoplanes lutulentus TaxID=1287878 RepID=A0A327Z8F3_9ACTN|nr:RNA polymerase sigma factor (sigma-70 family) [Actinoplanes lutulentus]
MRDDPEVIALVTAARDGDAGAWNALVERYAPLVWSTCRAYRLEAADAEDVGQTVWLSLIEHLPKIRTPAALPGWILTSTRREALRVLRIGQRTRPDDTLGELTADADPRDVDEELLAYEREIALRAAFTELPTRCQHLLSLLMQDPPPPYSVISSRMGMPRGSVGPIRARCLDRLRHCPALAAFIEEGSDSTGGGGTREQRNLA